MANEDFARLNDVLRDKTFFILLAVVAASSLLAMTFIPLASTSEPRYAEIARLMAASGDWITPWFSPGVPFWGKPPLSFWLQATSFNLFGVTEFAARFPSWLATALAIWIIYRGTLIVFDQKTARWAVLIYATCALVFIASGAVLTDPFFSLGFTLCMIGWMLTNRQKSLFWRYSFFIGLAIGLLAKGPLIIALAAGALGLWLVLNPTLAIQQLRLQHWLSGIALVLILVMPWYVAAEIKTPGFLDYFIVGEHFRRFIEPGWGGDLYGSAHRAPYGTIWYYWIQAAFPWWILAVFLLIKSLCSTAGRAVLGHALKDPNTRYVLSWTLITPLFSRFPAIFCEHTFCHRLLALVCYWRAQYAGTRLQEPILQKHNGLCNCSHGWHRWSFWWPPFW